MYIYEEVTQKGWGAGRRLGRIDKGKEQGLKRFCAFLIAVDKILNKNKDMSQEVFYFHKKIRDKEELIVTSLVSG